MSSTSELITLGDGAEFDAIRAMVARWGDRARGIGDDAAVLTLPRGDRLVVSVDTSIEGRHFRAEWLSPREIAYRAVTAALSDLAAMAAHPVGVLVALTLSDSWRSMLGEIADGVGDAVSRAGTWIVGGNVAVGSELSITTTVLGSAYAVLRRDGLRPGDLLYVTGRLGGSGAALAALRAGGKAQPVHHARFARPDARLREARWLAARGARCGIDISDGLAADAGHLAAASKVGIDIDLTLLPCVEGASDLDAASSGEEYELIVGTSHALPADEFESQFGIPLTRIGRGTELHAGVSLVRRGARVAIPPGYDHLSR